DSRRGEEGAGSSGIVSLHRSGPAAPGGSAALWPGGTHPRSQCRTGVSHPCSTPATLSPLFSLQHHGNRTSTLWPQADSHRSVVEMPTPTWPTCFQPTAGTFTSTDALPLPADRKSVV